MPDGDQVAYNTSDLRICAKVQGMGACIPLFYGDEVATMRVVRWTLLLLYLALVGGLWAVTLTDGDLGFVVVLCVMLVSLALFILGAGHKNLFRPIGRPRILFPVISSALMLTALLAGLTFALAELFVTSFPSEKNATVIAFWGSLLASWIFWSFILYVYTREAPRYQAIFRLAQLIFAGSIAELLACVPSHVFVTKRGGCFAGIGTAIGLLAGILVMIWSFGPAIFLLFLREANRGSKGGESTGKVTSPTVPARLQFRLRTLLLLVLLIAVICALLRSSWGDSSVAALAAWAVLVLLMPPLLARPWIMQVALLVVFAGLIYVSWGEWQSLTFLVIPTGILGLVLLKLALRGRTPRSTGQNEAAGTGEFLKPGDGVQSDK